MERRRSRPRPTRAGFTFVEVLVVILIIATLMALLLPAIIGAVRKAREGQVSAEMSVLATSLASFKNAYGDYPPSRVLLHELGFNAITTDGKGIAGASTTNSDQTDQMLVQRTKLYMQKFFSRVNFNDATAASNTTAQKFFDFNGNGVADGQILLTGSECLVFFLGGLPIQGTDSTGSVAVTGMSGFGRSPVNPFIAQNGVGGTNRTQPNFEFKSSQLIDLDGDGIPSYLDPFGGNPDDRRPYAYFSAYGVNGYDPNDVNDNGVAGSYETEDDPTSTSGGTVNVERGFLVNFPVYGSGGTTQSTLAKSPAPNPYTTGQPATGTVAWQNPNSFQLFSAGADRLWGLGGIYVQNSSNGSPLPQLPYGTTGTGVDPGLVHAFDADTANPRSGVRQRENDNLTNFSGGRLQ